MDKPAEFEKRLYQFYRFLYVKIETATAEILSREGLTVIQLRILAELEMTGGSSVGDLGVRLGMNTGNCSSACKRMEARGLLCRTRLREDERIVRVALSPEGAAALRRVFQHLHERQAPALSRLTQEEQDTLMDGMDRMEAYLKQF